ncbi:MAG: alpha-glucosidase [Butyricicoccus sp.]|nr:alpha-glucosidase [Butyricicoccus sp.]MBQ8585824.1 alpha-glucosidase [Butyricicoccus sp.]
MHTPWWKERVFYQIYPRSFQDSNGDGIGDLRGIISRLDYLKWLGIGAVWLCPVYDSPNADMGYDIRDYEKIMSEFGTMEDFDELVAELHKRDIKLVMDLVVNHSSDEHAWFAEARKSKDNPYRDYYIWRDGKAGKEPNNWASFFTPSAWSYDQATDQWYLHLFGEKQPDLNWENQAMRKEIYAMMNRWFDKGVDGFRMDVISLIAKAPGLPDGTGEGYVFSDEHFAFQPKLHEYLREMRKACFEGRDCMCVGETSFVTTQNANSVVGDGQELDLLFQFDIMDVDGENGKWNVIPFDLLKLKQIISAWQKAIDWNTLFWGNHDQPRVVSRFGSTETEEHRVQSAKMLATAMYLMRGTPFIYQGEEIGMTNYPFLSAEELRDIESINLLSEAEKTGKRAWAWNGILQKGRDNARTPVQWDGSENAGFSTGSPWININPNYKQINVENAKKDQNSILHYYRELIAFRNSSDVIKFGDFEMLHPSHGKLLIYRRGSKHGSVTVCCNFSGENAALPQELTGTAVMQSRRMDGMLGPYGFVVLASK